MLSMRSSPHSGIHRTSLRMASSAFCAEPVLVERDEPLLGGAEQRGVLAPPAVRVGVADRHLGQQRARRGEVGDDLRVRLPHGLAGEVRHLGDEAAVVVHRVVDLAGRLAARARSPPRRGRARCARARSPRPSPRSPRPTTTESRSIHGCRATVPTSSSPASTRRVPRARPLTPGRRATAPASGSARRSALAVRPRARCTSASGCTAMARLAGRVHGVVVQIDERGRRPPSGRGQRPGVGVFTGNFT